MVREGSIDFDLQFERFSAGFSQKALSRHQFKKMLIKNGAYNNEYDLDDLLKRLKSDEGVDLDSLKKLFENDYLINKLRMVARPSQVVDEIRDLLANYDPKNVMTRLALCDKNSDGILLEEEFV
jgi:hypothetical protein